MRSAGTIAHDAQKSREWASEGKASIDRMPYGCGHWVPRSSNNGGVEIKAKLWASDLKVSSPCRAFVNRSYFNSILQVGFPYPPRHE